MISRKSNGWWISQKQAPVKAPKASILFVNLYSFNVPVFLLSKSWASVCHKRYKVSFWALQQLWMRVQSILLVPVPALAFGKQCFVYTCFSPFLTNWDFSIIKEYIFHQQLSITWRFSRFDAKQKEVVPRAFVLQKGPFIVNQIHKDFTEWKTSMRK